MYDKDKLKGPDWEGRDATRYRRIASSKDRIGGGNKARLSGAVPCVEGGHAVRGPNNH